MQNKSVLRLVVAVLALITLTFTARVDGQMSPSLLTPRPPLSPCSSVRGPDSGAEYNVACDALPPFAPAHPLTPADISPTAPGLTVNPFFEPPDSPAKQVKWVTIGKGTIEIYRTESYSNPWCPSSLQEWEGKIPFVIVRVKDSIKSMGYVKGKGIVTWKESTNCSLGGQIACVYSYVSAGTATISGRFYGRGQCKIRISIVENYIQPVLAAYSGPGCKGDQGWAIMPSLETLNHATTAQFVLAKDEVYHEAFQSGEWEISPQLGVAPGTKSQWSFLSDFILRDPEVEPSTGCAAGAVIHRTYPKKAP